MTPIVCLFQVVKAEMVLWTAGFVLLTLVINAPLLPWVLRATGLNKGMYILLHTPDAYLHSCCSFQLTVREHGLCLCVGSFHDLVQEAQPSSNASSTAGELTGKQNLACAASGGVKWVLN